MSAYNMNTRNTVLILMIIGAIAMRFVTFEFQQLSNFTPVGAVALFAGTYFTDKWKSFLVPLVVLFLSNIGINYLYTGQITWFSWFDLITYSCFALTVLIGALIRKVNVLNVLAGSAASAVLFWLITDLPFLYGSYYTHDMSGYITSLTNALPFLRNMLMSDAVFGLLLYGGFELAKNRYTVLRSRHELAM
jgi:hypothetical protein